MGVDYLLQTEKYRIMIVEEAETRTELRKSAFASCGLPEQSSVSRRLLLVGYMIGSSFLGCFGKAETLSYGECSEWRPYYCHSA